MVFLKQTRLTILMLILLMSFPAFSKNVVKKINITGNRKIETETIKYKLVTKVGAKFSASKVKLSTTLENIVAGAVCMGWLVLLFGDTSENEIFRQPYLSLC